MPLPALSGVLMSAPCSNKASTVACSPLIQALCNGVSPVTKLHDNLVQSLLPSLPRSFLRCNLPLPDDPGVTGASTRPTSGFCGVVICITSANCCRSVNAGFIPGEARGDLSEELCFLRFLMEPALSPSV